MEASVYYCTEWHLKFKVPILDEMSLVFLGIGGDETDKLATGKAFADASELPIKRAANCPPPVDDESLAVDLFVNSILCEDVRAFIGAAHMMYVYDPISNESHRTPVRSPPCPFSCSVTPSALDDPL